MRISDQTIQQVRDAIDIEELVASYVTLKPAGKQKKACCPFHQEKTPSFFIRPERGTFKCFGCGESGDGIAFLMKMEHLDFQEAVVALAERYHIPIEADHPEDTEKRMRRDLYYRINEEAARFFYKQLLTSDAALQYLARRGFKAQIINDFFLGYADAKGNSLLRHLTEKGYREEDLLALGLIARSHRGTGYYDKFRDRLMFPIVSVKGKIIGFGGRAIGDGKPKYLNSPDSEIFHKGEHLYHLHQVRKIPNSREVIVVEGYMDVAALAFHGVPNAVASLGTSLTEEQAKLVKRYADRVYLCYDGDAAGIRAARRAIDVFQQADVSPKLVVLPEGKDPDDVVRTKGAEAFRHYLSISMDPLDFELKLLTAGYDLTEPAGRMDFLPRALDFLAGIEKQTLRDVMAEQVATLAQVSLESVQHDTAKRREELLAKQSEKNRHRAEKGRYAGEAFSSRRDTEADRPSYYYAEEEELPPEAFGDYADQDESRSDSLGMYADRSMASERFRLEREMVRLIRGDRACEDVLSAEQDFIENPGLQQLLLAVHNLRDAGISPQQDWLKESDLSDEARELAESLDRENLPVHVAMAKELRERIQRFRLRERKAELLYAMHHPDQMENVSSQSALLKELQEIEQRLRAPGGGLR
ncbi:DNA primase [Murdochiella vaginalis]|uniref:DNA primase n=1 Tax=Murdochiella vaginalis TaxID=1852373 RepID=UPI0008FE8C2E|nr:DNA primase [Murdochiella vaginalis]